MPWGLAAAAVTVGGSIYSGKQAKKTADKAADREQAAADAGLARQEEAFGDAQQLLNPYVRQEQAASSQLMSQLGLGGGGGGGGGATMGGGWGFTDPGSLTAGTGQVSGVDRFMQDLVRDQVAISGRAGYNGDKAIAEGSRRAITFLTQLKNQGKLPQDYQIPTMTDLNQIGAEQVEQHGGLKALRRSGVAGGKRHGGANGYGIGDVTGLYDQYFPEGFEATQGGIAQPGGPGGTVGGVHMMGDGAGGGAGPGGGAFTAGDIMGMAGVEGLPEGFTEDYFGAVDAAGQPVDLGFGTDFRGEEFQGYMGLTPESLDVSGTYQANPAYQAAREQGIETVNQGAAGTGTLYSGRRGEALRDVGQDVEQRYYFDAANRRADMMGARRQTYGAELARRLAERESDLARRGSIYEAGKQREQSYYNNYMSLLSSMAQPQSTTNLASMGTSLGKDTAANLMGTARQVSDLKIGAQGAQQAAMADAMGGIVNLGTAYLGRD